MCVALFAQPPAATPLTFEAASIKPTQSAPGSASGMSESKGRLVAKNVTLKRCVRGAYNVPESQIVGGPKWADQDRYDIEANAAVPAGDQELMLMLRSLLADRFKLALHVEQREVPGYRLVVARAGLKARASASDGRSIGHSTRSRIDAEGCSMAQLAQKLAEVLHQPVLDATGVAGRFDVKLEWSPDDMQAKLPPADRSNNAPDTAAGPSIFAALQDQLGLRLEAAKVRAEVLVIDSAEKPSAN